MKKEYIVYMHISPSDKRYIGITSQKRVKKRWVNGKGYKNNIPFSNAINKYGWDNFEHIIIARGLTEDEAKWLEVELIREWDTTNRDKGYNLTLGGEGGNGLKGERNGMFGRCGELNPFYGKTLSEESKKKISEANKGKKHSEETKALWSKQRKGHKPTNNLIILIEETGEIFMTQEECAIRLGYKTPSSITKFFHGKIKNVYDNTISPKKKVNLIILDKKDVELNGK